MDRVHIAQHRILKVWQGKVAQPGMAQTAVTHPWVLQRWGLLLTFEKFQIVIQVV